MSIERDDFTVRNPKGLFLSTEIYMLIGKCNDPTIDKLCFLRLNGLTAKHPRTVIESIHNSFTDAVRNTLSYALRAPFVIVDSWKCPNNQLVGLEIER